MSASQRPTSVTVICWILIVLGAMGAISLSAQAGRDKLASMARAADLSVAVMTVWVAVRLALNVLFGIAMLLRQNWARWGYVLLGAALIVAGALLFGFKRGSFLAIAIYLVFVYFLTTAAASAYFTGKTSAPPEQEPDTQE